MGICVRLLSIGDAFRIPSIMYRLWCTVTVIVREVDHLSQHSITPTSAISALRCHFTDSSVGIEFQIPTRFYMWVFLPRVRRGPPNAVRHHGEEKEEEVFLSSSHHILHVKVQVVYCVRVQIPAKGHKTSGSQLSVFWTFCRHRLGILGTETGASHIVEYFLIHRLVQQPWALPRCKFPFCLSNIPRRHIGEWK
jgi:hypothetical protein